MADKKISALTGATTPLAGTEVLPIVQSGATVKVAVSDLTAGRAVATGALTTSGNIRVQYSAAGNVSSISNNTASTSGSISQFIATNDAGRNFRIQYSASGGTGGAALTNGIATEPAESEAELNGNPEQITPPEVHATDVEPVTIPRTVTTLPTFVYVPFELNEPTTVSPAP